jgi:molecular chaperone DnaJ
MPSRDYYEILGVARTASDADIKRAYRNLARRHHPDVHHERDKAGAELRFKEINEAYSVLSDGNKRAQYDRFGTVHVQPGPAGFGDFAPFGDIFDAFFGGAGRRAGPARGADLRYDVSVSLEEVLTGVPRDIKFDHLATCDACGGSGAADNSRPVACPDCRGSGQVRSMRNTLLGQFVSTSPCHRCAGAGSVIVNPCKACRGQSRRVQQRRLNVKVPAGVEDGTRIRYAGLGEAGERGGSSGDLYIFVSVLEHETYERHGADIHCDTEVSFTQAALGARLEIEGLDGIAKLELPPGTQSGTRFRVPGHGLPRMRGSSRGDLLVDVNVRVPTRLTKKQRELLEAFARAGGEDVHDRGFFKKVKEAFGGE